MDMPQEPNRPSTTLHQDKPSAPRRPLWCKLMRAAAWLLLAVMVLLSTAYYIVTSIVLPPEQLAKVVSETVNRQINGELSIERLEFTLIGSFPDVTLRADSGSLISYSELDTKMIRRRQFARKDTLARFRELYLSISPLRLLLGYEIDVEQVRMVEPQLYLHATDSAVNNWSRLYLAPTSTDSLEDTTTVTIPAIYRASLAIERADVHLVQPNLTTVIEDLSLELKATKDDDATCYEAHLVIDDLMASVPRYDYHSRHPIRFEANAEVAHCGDRITVEPLSLCVDSIHFETEGTALYDLQRGTAELNLHLETSTSSLQHLYDLIPPRSFEQQELLRMDGQLRIAAHVTGELSGSSLPNADLTYSLYNGALYRIGRQGVRPITLEGKAHINSNDLDQSVVTIDRFDANSPFISMHSIARVIRPISNPHLTAQIEGQFDLDSLSAQFPSTTGTYGKGRMELTIEGQGSLDDLVAKRYQRIELMGEMSLEKLAVVSPTMMLNAFVSNGKLTLTPHTTYPNFVGGAAHWGATLTTDSLHIVYGDDIMAQTQDATAHLGMLLSNDTTKRVPIYIFAGVKRLAGRLDTATSFRSGKSSAIFSIQPSQTRTGRNDTRVVVHGKRVAFRTQDMRLGVRKMDAHLRILPAKVPKHLMHYTQAQRDSLRKVRRAKMTEAQRNRNRYRLFDIEGTFALKRLGGRLTNLPLKLRIDSSEVTLTSNELRLADMHLRIGRSDLRLNGELDNIKGYIFRRDTLGGELRAKSKRIDLNEIMNALHLYASSAETATEAIDLETMDDSDFDDVLSMNDADTIAIDTITTDYGLIPLPRRVNLKFDLAADLVKYRHLELYSTSGMMSLYKGCLKLDQMDLYSNLGNARLSMLYKMTSRKKAFTGFDVRLDQIQIKEMLALYPSIDSLLPIMRSLEGIVNSDLAASVELDSTATPILSTLEAACHISGRNMVVMDSETFTSLAKMLMFKNKQRNIIESASVDLVVHDNEIEIYPFFVDIDRYHLGIGGKQYLDMSFDYHISVLKWMLPIKLGVNVTGTTDDWSFRLVKPHYIKGNTVASHHHLEAHRVSIRQSLYDRLQESIRMSPLYVSEQEAQQLASEKVRDMAYEMPRDTILEVRPEDLGAGFPDSLLFGAPLPIPPSAPR